MTVGIGHAHCHHGEILQGIFLDARGHRHRGLVTLPIAHPDTHARFVPGPGSSLTVDPPTRTKALDAARLAAAECSRITGRPCRGGVLQLRGNVPVGLGMGSSTSDAIAAVRAVAASFGVQLSPATLARLTVHAERACDPLMLDDRPRLFAQREGVVLEELGESLPAAVVIGCLTGGGEPVETLAVASDARLEDEIYAFERLRALLRRAVAESDLGLLGHVCTTSARYNQRVLAKEEFSELERIADRTGAAGVQVAHSGNVAGLLFDPATPGSRLRRCVRMLRHSDIPVTRVFRTGEGRTERERGQPHLRGDRQAGPGATRRPTCLPAVRDNEDRLRGRRRPAPARQRHRPTR